MNYLVRIELWCGSDETPDGLQLAEERYRKANQIAMRFNINTYFEVHEEKGVTYADGYLYPHSGNVIDVLKYLDLNGVEYDNIDIPEVARGSELHMELLNRYPRWRGVSVNPGEIESSGPEPHTISYSKMNSRGRGWFDDPYRHALASRGISSRFLYHGTSTSALEGIRQEGLDPFAKPKMWEGMSLDYIYFTLSEEDAESFSRTTVSQMKKKSGQRDIRNVVLRIDQEEIEDYPHIRGAFELDEAQSDMEDGVWFTYDGDIPPHLIEVRDREGNWRRLI